jgi:hypothetical protein
MRPNLLQAILSKLDFEYQEKKKVWQLIINQLSRFCFEKVLIIDYKTRTDRPQRVYLNVPKSIKSEPAAVYILWENEDIIYIGQSIRWCSRVLSHVRNPKSNKKKATHFTVLPTEKEALNRCEKELISLFKPRYNIQHK